MLGEQTTGLCVKYSHIITYVLTVAGGRGFGFGCALFTVGPLSLGPRMKPWSRTFSSFFTVYDELKEDENERSA